MTPTVAKMICPLDRATRSARMASTRPSRSFGTTAADPDNTALAAA